MINTQIDNADSARALLTLLFAYEVVALPQVQLTFSNCLLYRSHLYVSRRGIHIPYPDISEKLVAMAELHGTADTVTSDFFL